MEKQMEEDMETGIVWWFAGFSLPYDSTWGSILGCFPPIMKLPYGLFEGVEGV